jgi:hypothetical protein
MSKAAARKINFHPKGAVMSRDTAGAIASSAWSCLWDDPHSCDRVLIIDHEFSHHGKTLLSLVQSWI